jgi:hypothetical protein
MLEYARVSASTYDLDSLVNQLNERAASGWEVVSIIPTGADVTAIVAREASVHPDDDAKLPVAAGAMGAAGAVESSEIVVEDATVPSGDVGATEPPIAAPQPSEPEGWAVAPDAVAQPAAADPTVAAASTAAATAAPEPTPAPTPTQAAPAQQQQAASSTPAGWYPDPSGRFELRYWDGTQWTEYVSRGGQQYTDPPVA